MKTDTMMTLLRSDGTAVIPAGRFAPFADITTKSTLPAPVRKLPVLTTQFNTALNSSGFPNDVHVGWGAIETNRMPILPVRFQFRDLMAYWFANPPDEEVWSAFEQWNSAKTMVVAPVFDSQAYIVSRDFDLVPQARALRSSWMKQGPKANELFLRSAAELILSGCLADGASSDIATVPELVQVIGCIVATESCAPNWPTGR
jgi:hypothetical protein